MKALPWEHNKALYLLLRYITYVAANSVKRNVADIFVRLTFLSDFNQISTFWTDLHKSSQY